MSRILQILVVLSACVLLADTASAKIYKWKDADGKVHFGDRPPENQKVDEIKAPAEPARDSTSSDASNQPDIVIYTTSWCGYCKKAKAYFSVNNMPYKEYDIEKDRFAKREYDNIGGKGVPVILVGDQRMNGFDKDGFDRIYKIAK